MFRLTAGETWLDGLDRFDPVTGRLNYGTAVFVNRRARGRGGHADGGGGK